MHKVLYRTHMRIYSRETMAMSFVVTKHPDYESLLTAGKEIIPFLLEDIRDPNWYCTSCFGYGYDFVPTWDTECDENCTHPPRSTGEVCPKCKGKGNINSWACMTLLAQIAGDDRPVVEERIRGRHDPLVNMWLKWGQERGYITLAPGELDMRPKVGFRERLRKFFLDWYRA